MSRPSAFKPFDILELSKKLVVASYALTGNLPPEEKTNLTFYLRNAAVQVYVQSTQVPFSKKKKARQKLIEAAKNSLVIIDAIVDVVIEVGLITGEATTEVMQLSSTCYQLLDRLKKQK